MLREGAKSQLIHYVWSALGIRFRALKNSTQLVYDSSKPIYTLLGIAQTCAKMEHEPKVSSKVMFDKTLSRVESLIARSRNGNLLVEAAFKKFSQAVDAERYRTAESMAKEKLLEEELSRRIANQEQWQKRSILAKQRAPDLVAESEERETKLGQLVSLNSN